MLVQKLQKRTRADGCTHNVEPGYCGIHHKIPRVKNVLFSRNASVYCDSIAFSLNKSAGTV